MTDREQGETCDGRGDHRGIRRRSAAGLARGGRLPEKMARAAFSSLCDEPSKSTSVDVPRGSRGHFGGGLMSYRLPDVLIQERQTPVLVISLMLVAVCAFGACRARQMAEQGPEVREASRCESCLEL